MEVPVRRTERGLGVVVSPNNVILELAPGGSAAEDRQLQTGDVVVGIDGQALVDMEGGLIRVKDRLPQLPKKPVHLFQVIRKSSRYESYQNSMSESSDTLPYARRAPVSEKGEQNTTPAGLLASEFQRIKKQSMDDDEEDMATVITGPRGQGGAAPAGGAGSLGYASAAPRAAPGDSMEMDFDHRPKPRPVDGWSGAGLASSKAVAGDVEMTLLMLDGSRFTQVIAPPSQLGSAQALCDMVLEAWTSAAMRAPPSPLRGERQHASRLLIPALL